MKNTSDYIEEHIKSLLEQVNVAEVKRSELALRFSVVPSQINYVLKTRFTLSRGYIVESKRGGGGYIRIGRIAFSDKHDLLLRLLANLGQELSFSTFQDLIQNFFDDGLLQEKEGNLLLALATDQVLGGEAPRIRARMMRQIVGQIDRKEE